MLFEKHFTGKSDTNDYLFEAKAELLSFLDGLEDVAPFLFMAGTYRANLMFDSNIISNKEATDYKDNSIELGYMQVTKTPQSTSFDVNVYLFNCFIMKDRFRLTFDQVIYWTLAHEFGHIAFVLSEPLAEVMPEETHEQYANQFAENIMGFGLRWR